MTEPRNGNMPPDDHEYAMWDAAYVLDALSDTDRREFEMHLANCGACREAVAELDAIAPMLSALDDQRAEAPPCPELLPGLLAKAEQRLVANRVAPSGTESVTSSSTLAPAMLATLRASSWAHTPP